MTEKKKKFMGEAPRLKKFIMVSVKNRDALIKELNCKKSAFYNAMNFTSDSEQAQLLRFKALNEYGGVVAKKWIMK